MVAGEADEQRGAVQEVDVWFWSLDASPQRIAALRETLSAEERARAGRFAFPGLRDRWTVAHAGLRAILAGYAGGRAEALAFETSEHGKPSLAAGPHFNLTHSEGFAALAVAQAPVGVDLEQIGEAHADVARLHFSPEEAAWFEAAPQEHRAAAFYRCWTAKEAFLKALGTGFSQPSESFTLAFEPGRPIALVEAAWLAADLASWRFSPFEIHPRFAGCVALRDPGGEPSLRLRPWEPGST